MSRPHLTLPNTFLFSTEMVVRVKDINYGGHLANDSVLSMIHEARIRFLRYFGYQDERDIGGAGLIMTDAVILYRSEAFLENRLKIQVGISDFSKVGFDMVFKIHNQNTNQDVAHAKTGLACFVYETRKLTQVPSSFMNKFISNPL